MHTYFKQNFAQVTNPPIDPIREELVMSLVSFIGPRPNLLDLESSSGQKRLEVPQPILLNSELRKIREIGDIPDNDFKTITQDITWPASEGRGGMKAAIDKLCWMPNVKCVMAIISSFCQIVPPAPTIFLFHRCWRPRPCIII